MHSKKIAIALSGGMDSAATVLLLREQGFEPQAVYLDMLDRAADRQHAMVVAQRLGIPLHIESCGNLFQKAVVEPLLTAHAAGLTPAPCSLCNPTVKWLMLAAVADRLGIERIATGHYTRIIQRGGHHYFARGIDEAKDQSYYLWGIPESLIRRAVLPLGDYTKAAVRERLRTHYGWPELAAQRESMGVCFLTEEESYADFLRCRLPDEILKPGAVIDVERGLEVGAHAGAALYTVGQKRGFTVDNGMAGYAVTKTDVERNLLFVSADPQALYTHTLTLVDWRATDLSELLTRAEDDLQLMVRGFGRNPTQKGCRVKQLPDGQLQLTLLHDPAWAVCPGQPCAFYLDDRLVGGGVVGV